MKRNISLRGLRTFCVAAEHESFREAAQELFDRYYIALALSNLGVLQAAKGSPDSARRAFEEALELGTGLSAPEVNLARIARSDTPNA